MPTTFTVPGRLPSTAPSPGNAPGSGSFPKPGLPPAPSSPPTTVPPSPPPNSYIPPQPAPPTGKPTPIPPALPAAASPAGLVPGFGGVVGGTLGFLAFDLLFPPPAAAPEAPPGIPPGASPLYEPPPGFAPVRFPPGGIQSDGQYEVKVTNLLFNPVGTFVEEQFSNLPGSGSQIPQILTDAYRLLNFVTRFDEKRIIDIQIVLLSPGTQPITQPDYQPFQEPLGFTQPLQQPFPIDIFGFPTPNLPALPPEKERDPPRVPGFPPFIPQKQPENPAFPVPPVELPPVLPDQERNAPPVPYVPPISFPLPPALIPPGVVPVITDTPTLTDGFYNPPGKPPAPPVVETKQRTPGADCCFIPKSECEECDLSEVLKKLDELLECACEKGFRRVTKSLGVGDSGSFSLPDRSVLVALQVSSVGTRVRSESGNSKGETIYYLGSYALGTDGKWGDRRPIAFVGNAYRVARGENSFQYQLNFGSSAIVEVVYEIPIKP